MQDQSQKKFVGTGLEVMLGSQVTEEYIHEGRQGHFKMNIRFKWRMVLRRKLQVYLL